MAAVTRAFQQRGDAALLFESVRGTQLPVVTNLYSSRERVADIAGAGDDTFCRRWSELVSRAADSQGAAIATVERPTTLVAGKLSDLPLLTYHAKDAGPYFTSAIYLAKHPDTGTPNLSFHRSMYVSDSELRVRLGDTHNLAAYYRAAEARDEPLEAVLLLGAAPEIFMGACASIPEGASELDLAATLAGTAIASYQGTTVDLPVPASSQVVVEGRFLPHERRSEGPFGEFLGYYVPEAENPVFEVTAVYWQPDAVFHSILCGSAEDHVPMQAVNAAKTFAHLDARLPGILDVSCAPGFMNTTIRIRQAYEGHARQVLLAAFSADMDYNKLCIVVDEDDDPADIAAAIRAFVNRGRVDHRVMVIDDVPGFYRDPHRDHWGRVGIDATRPFGRSDEFVKKSIPGVEDIDPDDYL
ncbi:MAG: UbiD family decarboxylase [Chromatiales bacterium]|nr:MAG: UbiD family decarboxylase [Chromatiales bacterium]